MARISPFALGLGLLFSRAGAADIELPDGFVDERVVEGITGAVALAIAPDGRLFICEQTGALRVVRAGALLPAPFVSLAVDSYWERGLIGVALDPQFPQEPYVYVHYIPRAPYPHHRISRFTASGDIAQAASEKILFEGPDQRAVQSPVLDCSLGWRQPINIAPRWGFGLGCKPSFSRLRYNWCPLVQSLPWNGALDRIHFVIQSSSKAQPL